MHSRQAADTAGSIMVAWAPNNVSAACDCCFAACLLGADHRKNGGSTARHWAGSGTFILSATAETHLRSAHLIPAAHNGEHFSRPRVLPRQLPVQRGSAGAGRQRHRHSMPVQVPQQATCSRQELCLVPPAWKRQSLGVLCGRHTMLVQRLQQATGMRTSMSLAP